MTGQLVLLSGLPGTGKSTLGRALAEATGGVHLEVDVVEAAIEASFLAPKSAENAGYLVIVAQTVALNAQGHLVIADMVNADPRGRALWDPDTADLIVEIISSDQAVHRRRVEARHAKNPSAPTWEQVQARIWVPWDRSVMTLDAATLSVEAMVTQIQATLA